MAQNDKQYVIIDKEEKKKAISQFSLCSTSSSMQAQLVKVFCIRLRDSSWMQNQAFRT